MRMITCDVHVLVSQPQAQHHDILLKALFNVMYFSEPVLPDHYGGEVPWASGHQFLVVELSAANSSSSSGRRTRTRTPIKRRKSLGLDLG